MALQSVNGAPSFEDTVQYSSDSSSEVDEEEEPFTLGVQVFGSSESGPDQVKKKTSWLKRLTSSAASTKGMSIQSGDIIRSPTSTSPGAVLSSPVHSPVAISPPAMSTSPGPQPQQANALGGAAASSSRGNNGYAPLTVLPPPPLPSTTIRLAPAPQTDDIPPSINAKGGWYALIFRIVYSIVRYNFLAIKFKKSKFQLPVISIVYLIVNVVVMGVLLGVCLSVFPPRINLSIESFGIPNHPAQTHWDAFNAAKHKVYSNSTQPSNLQSAYAHGVVKKRSAHLQPRSLIRQPRAAFPDCPTSSYNHYQYALHLNWEMDLVFRVPTSNKDTNILRLDRIKYIHSVEEQIYNSTEYKHFCHKKSGTNLCDPLNSLLTWLYPRNPQTGRYIYNTTDGFTPNLPKTMRSLSANLSIALWFTGGELNVVNSTHVEARLLRSQIRIGLPLPCFQGLRDNREEQKKLVTDYFTSLMPVFDGLATR